MSDPKNLDGLKESNPELYEYILDLRKENADKRVKNKDLEDKLSDVDSKLKELNDIKTKLADEERKKKLEDGKKDELLQEYEQKEKELLRKLSEVEPEANKYKQYLTNKQNSIKEKLKDKWKESYSNLPLEDLEALSEELLAKKNPPIDLDNPGGHGSEKNPFKKGQYFSLTEQVRLKKVDPTLYEKLKKEAQT